MPLLTLFQLMQHQVDTISAFKSSLPVHDKEQFCKDCHRMMPNFYINGKKIKPTPEQMQKLKSNNYELIRKTFLTMLTENGIKLHKLNPEVIDSFINGFHQLGYAEATSNALSLGELGLYKNINPLSTRQFHIFQDPKKLEQLHVTETVKIHLLFDARDPEQMKKFEGYQSELEKSKEDQSKPEKYPPIAKLDMTYTFSNKSNVPDITENWIERYPRKDKHKMLRHLPDDRTLVEKFKNFFQNRFTKPKGEALIKANKKLKHQTP